MKVHELIQALSNFPSHYDVVIGARNGYCVVNKVEKTVAIAKPNTNFDFINIDDLNKTNIIKIS